MAISSASFSASATLRQTVQRLQSELSTRQTELSTGQVADAGLSLGGHIDELISFQQSNSLLSTYQNTNSMFSTRLDQTQAALTSLNSAASDLQSAAISVSSGGSVSGLVSQAKASLDSIVSALNTTVNGDYIFGGLNSSQAPATNYSSPPGTAQAAVASAFQTAFGMPQNAATATSITPAAMTSYLNGPFANLFADPQWGQLWSNASNTNVTVQISPGQNVTVNANANDPSIRKLMMAATMLSDTSLQNLSPATAQVVINQATTLANEAVSGLSAVQTDVGLTQNRVTTATEQITATQNSNTTGADNLDGADPYQTATRISELQTQLESSYQLTAQLQQLSLSRFL